VRTNQIQRTFQFQGSQLRGNPIAIKAGGLGMTINTCVTLPLNAKETVWTELSEIYQATSAQAIGLSIKIPPAIEWSAEGHVRGVELVRSDGTTGDFDLVFEPMDDQKHKISQLETLVRLNLKFDS
jgi:hypothetical protein